VPERNSLSKPKSKQSKQNQSRVGDESKYSSRSQRPTFLSTRPEQHLTSQDKYASVTRSVIDEMCSEAKARQKVLTGMIGLLRDISKRDRIMIKQLTRKRKLDQSAIEHTT